MRGRSDILGSLHNRTLHILIRQLPLFVNQTGTLHLLAKVVSNGDKNFLAYRTRNVGLFWAHLGYFVANFCTFWCNFYSLEYCGHVPKLTNIRYDLKLQMKSNFKLPGYCRSVHECCDAYYCG